MWTVISWSGKQVNSYQGYLQLLLNASRIWNCSFPRSKYALFFGGLQCVDSQTIMCSETKYRPKSRKKSLRLTSTYRLICLRLPRFLTQIAAQLASNHAVSWMKSQAKVLEMVKLFLFSRLFFSIWCGHEVFKSRGSSLQKDEDFRGCCSGWISFFKEHNHWKWGLSNVISLAFLCFHDLQLFADGLP